MSKRSVSVGRRGVGLPVRSAIALCAAVLSLMGCGAMPTPGLPQAAAASDLTTSARKRALDSWRDDIIYFALTDRFSNGDRTNDRHVNAKDPHAYHGGDLAGLTKKLPYIKDLGATALWITPINDNKDDAFVGKYWGFHGYWIHDFNRVEEHLGDEADLKRLVDTAHGMGIKVMLDIVVNHAGYDAPIAKDPQRRSWFHHNGNIANWDDQYQLEHHDIFGLPDFNTENPEVLDYMVDVWSRWITRAGVDGFRVDTVKHVPKPFWAKFNAAVANRAPKDFLMLGEVLNGDTGYVSSYIREGRFDTTFDFPMYFTMADVFARGQSMRKLGERLRQDGAYPDAGMLSTFLDNHDVPRFMSTAGGDERKLRLALTFLMTARGIPCVYYGTEVAMEGAAEPDNREDMRFGSNPRLTAFVKKLTSLRKQLPALRRGRMLEMWQDDDVYAFTRLAASSSSGSDEVVVAMNNADRDRRVTVPIRRESGLPDGTVLEDRLSGTRFTVTDRSITLTMAPKQGMVLSPAAGVKPHRKR
ncbi:MAG: alpha-amylase family glycosyl hydrolase [Candidatus Sericytochromatia bacterium]|nr:alpha-amylase family glycosyl hydrolase [Candidatus Sericytochromatia bacterium]